MPLAPDTPSWRWQKVVEQADNSPSRAAFFLSKDPLVSRLYRFSQDEKHGRPIDPTDPVATAARIYLGRERLRLYIECLLLGGCDNKYIADRVPMLTPEEVGIYHDAFFDVRQFLKFPAWIVETIMNGELYQPMSRRDFTGLSHRLAWMCGPDIVDILWTGKIMPDKKGKLAEHVFNYMQVQTSLLVMTFGNKGEQDLEIIKMSVEKVADVISASGAIDEDAQVKDTVLTFLQQFPIGVADPTLPENLELPAREPRIADLVKA